MRHLPDIVVTNDTFVSHSSRGDNLLRECFTIIGDKDVTPYMAYLIVRGATLNGLKVHDKRTSAECAPSRFFLTPTFVQE